MGTAETDIQGRETIVWKAVTSIQGAAALVSGGNRGFGRPLVDQLLDRGGDGVRGRTVTLTPPGQAGRRIGARRHRR